MDCQELITMEKHEVSILQQETTKDVFHGYP